MFRHLIALIAALAATTAGAQSAVQEHKLANGPRDQSARDRGWVRAAFARRVRPDNLVIVIVGSGEN